MIARRLWILHTAAKSRVLIWANPENPRSYIACYLICNLPTVWDFCPSFVERLGEHGKAAFVYGIYGLRSSLFFSFFLFFFIFCMGPIIEARLSFDGKASVVRSLRLVNTRLLLQGEYRRRRRRDRGTLLSIVEGNPREATQQTIWGRGRRQTIIVFTF